MAETCGGLGPSAVELIRAMAQAGGEQLAVWSRQDIIRQLAGGSGSGGAAWRSHDVPAGL